MRPIFCAADAKTLVIVSFLLVFPWHLLCLCFLLHRAAKAGRNGTGRDGVGPTRAAAATWDWMMGQAGPTSTSSFALCSCFTTLLFHLLSHFCSGLSLFSVEYNNRRGWAGGTGLTRAATARQEGPREEAGGQRVRMFFFVLVSLLSSLLHFTLLFFWLFFSSKYNNRWDRTNAGAVCLGWNHHFRLGQRLRHVKFLGMT